MLLGVSRLLALVAATTVMACEMAKSPARASDGTTAAGAVARAPREARDLWMSYCAACHGVSGQGTPVAMVRMDTAWQRARTDSVLRHRITVGVAGTTMAPWGRQLSAGEIEVLVAYVRGLARR